VLRNAFYMDMVLEKFDAGGVVRGPARQGRGAFVSREDVARTAAAVLLKQPGGTYDVTGPEALSVAGIAGRLSPLVGRQLRYEDESADAARERLSKLEPLAWRVELSVGWFLAIAAGGRGGSTRTDPPFHRNGAADARRLFPGIPGVTARVASDTVILSSRRVAGMLFACADHATPVLPDARRRRCASS